jgi:hypothetical protein
VTANDGAHTASCQLGVTAYDPAGANGFVGANTTCVAAATTPVAGSGGCPAGAAVLQQSNFGSAISSKLANGKQVLFHCGDTFTGGAGINYMLSKFTIGAYGGCQNTTSNRPIVSLTGGASGITINGSNTTSGPTDGRIIDIDFEGNNHSGLDAIYASGGVAGYVQLTMYNLMGNELQGGYETTAMSQSGLVESVMNGATTQIGTFLNYAGTNCMNGSTAFQCGLGNSSPSNYGNVQYNTVMGSDINGTGLTTAQTLEAYRMSACRMCVFSNNTFQNGSPGGGASFKLHEANSYNSQETWLGLYTEYVEFADNLITGVSGSQATEFAPQNTEYDERLRYFVIERNIFQSNMGSTGGKNTLISGQNITLRDNVFNQTLSAGGSQGMQLSQRGGTSVGNCTTCNQWPTQYLEVYNNTIYGGSGILISNAYYSQAPAVNSVVENNLCYTGTCVSNSGTGNTVSNNTTNTALNPGWTNASGTLSLMSDFKPTANYSGGMSVPVWYDALGTSWSPTWNLGAVQN